MCDGPDRLLFKVEMRNDCPRERQKTFRELPKFLNTFVALEELHQAAEQHRRKDVARGGRVGRSGFDDVRSGDALRPWKLGFDRERATQKIMKNTPIKPPQRRIIVASQ